MANTELLEKPWLDILPPPAPVGNELWLGLIFVALSLFVLTALFYLWQRRPRQQALQQLKRIQKRVEHDTLDKKLALYEINRILCRGLRLNGLSGFIPPAGRVLDWQKFYQSITTLQYNKSTPPEESLRQLLRDAQHWLRSSQA